MINQVKRKENPLELEHTQEMQKQHVHTFRKGKARVLSSDKIVGDLRHWNVMQNNCKLSTGTHSPFLWRINFKHLIKKLRGDTNVAKK